MSESYQDTIELIGPPLGKGAFGETYCARVHDPDKKRQWGEYIAVKKPRDRELEEILINELIINAALHITLQGIISAHIVRYLGFCRINVGPEGAMYVMLMEFCSLGNLRQIMKKKPHETPLSLCEKISIIKDVCRGLSDIHKCKLFHRDVKPENILLVPGPSGGYVAKVSDFGISKFLFTSQITSSIHGSLPYLSPDVLKGEANITSDLYSLGIVLYELITGKHPYITTNPESIIQNILESNPVPPKELNSQISEKLNQLILTMLNKDHMLRIQSSEEVLHCLDEISPLVIPDEIGDKLMLIDECIHQNEIDRAFILIQDLFRHHEDDPRVILRMGEFYNRCRLYNEAIGIFRLGLVKHPGNSLFHRDLAIALFKIGQIKDAITHISAAIEIGLEESLEEHALDQLKTWRRLDNIFN